MALDLVGCPCGCGASCQAHCWNTSDWDDEPRVPAETTRRVLAAGFSGICDCGSDMVACDKCGLCISHCRCSR